MAPEHAILTGAALATFGWLYAARRARTLAKKQHTLNVMLQASFNMEFRDAQETMRPHLLAKACPEITAPGFDPAERAQFRMVLNHYELLSAGIRNGDFDERMVRDSQRSTLLTAYETCEPQIFKMREDRRRQSTYEHLEWLHKRWEKKPPSKLVRRVEWIKGAPFSGSRVDPLG